MKDIGDLRDEIDSIDEKLVKLFVQRMEVAEQIANFKKENNLPVFNAQREEQVLELVSSKAQKPFNLYIKELYEKIFEISRKYQTEVFQEKRFGLIGRNLVHSFSKEVHGGLADYSYELINLEPEELEPFFNRREFSGCNVTIPYKRDAYALCQEISPQAKKIGCVNTVVVQKDGSLFGDNTDYYGFLYMAKRAGVDFNGKKVLIFGNGATSSTVKAVVTDCGGNVVVVSRNGENNYTNLLNNYDAEIIINATPVGTYPETENQITDLKHFSKCEAVLDVVYNPLRSRLVQQAKEMNLKTSGGLSMLVAQAKKACEIFTDKEISDAETERLISEIENQKQNIVLIGMPGSGKSTVANLLSQKLNRLVLDTDLEIEKQEHSEIPVIFEKKGEMYFRAKECEIIAQTAKKSGVIISTGGGSVLTARNRKNLKQNGFVVFLDRKLELLGTENRPLSQGDGALQKLYQERLPIYTEFCDVKIDNNGSIQQTVELILQAVEAKK